MPARTYRNLPLETLQDLLIVAVRDMLAAVDQKKDDGNIAFNAMKRQVAILLELIEEKRQQKIDKN